MRYNYITQFTSHNSTPGASSAAVFGYPRTIQGFTYHWWGDPNARPTFDGVVSWLSRPGGNTSAHYVVEDGRVACIVAPYDVAWAGGSARANATQLHIEMNPRASAGDYKTIGQFSSQLIDAFGDQLKYKHSDWVATQCPGHYDIDRIDRDSYTWISGKEWGEVYSKAPKDPTPAPPVEQPKPQPQIPEWQKNLVDIEDVKLTVLPAGGAKRVDLLTGKEFGDVIPRGTNIDIWKETSIGGKRYYISEYSAKGNIGVGIVADHLGVPVVPPVQEKPEWLKNLKDIEDKDFWTRSETSVLNIENGEVLRTIPVNTQVRVTHSTKIAEIDLLVLEGEKEVIEPLYLSDTPISNPDDDLEKRVSALEKLVDSVVKFLSELFKGFNKE